MHVYKDSVTVLSRLPYTQALGATQGTKLMSDGELEAYGSNAQKYGRGVCHGDGRGDACQQVVWRGGACAAAGYRCCCLLLLGQLLVTIYHCCLENENSFSNCIDRQAFKTECIVAIWKES